MKKSTVVILTAIILVLGVALGAALPYVIAEFKEEVQDTKIEIKKENNIKKNVSGTTDKGKVNTENSQGTKPSADKEESNNFISETNAREIALKGSGLSESDITYEYIKLEKDDGVWQYEIEFRQGRTEYDINIHAETGDIISYDVDYDN